jgi:hypothetical protein
VGFIHGFGLAASILVAVSISMRNIKWLRIINLAGSLLFVLYGYWIESLPVVLLNVFTAGVNIYYFFKLRTAMRSDYFDIMFTDVSTDEYVIHFLAFYGDDIIRFFPSFDPDPEIGTLAGTECCFILRKTLPVSLVAFRRELGDEIAILLDYAIPEYRDLKNARFFFNTAAERIASPGMYFSAAGEVPAHISYLRRLGFEEVGQRADNAVLFQKKV